MAALVNANIWNESGIEADIFVAAIYRHDEMSCIIRWSMTHLVPNIGKAQINTREDAESSIRRLKV